MQAGFLSRQGRHGPCGGCRPRSCAGMPLRPEPELILTTWLRTACASRLGQCGRTRLRDHSCRPCLMAGWRHRPPAPHARSHPRTGCSGSATAPTPGPIPTTTSKGQPPATSSISAARSRRHRLAARANVRPQYVLVPADQRFEAVRDGQVDILCDPSSVTLPRREMVDFSLPTFVDGAGVISRTSKPVQRFEDLGGKRDRRSRRHHHASRLLRKLARRT